MPYRDLQKRLNTRRQYRAKHKDLHNAWSYKCLIKKKYGLTEEAWNALYESQNGRCAICQDGVEKGRNACVDHDHISGKVRSILCRQCNTLLGNARERGDILSAAKAYLKQHK